MNGRRDEVAAPRGRWAVGACALLATVVGLFQITVPALWRDESVTAHFARLPLNHAWREWGEFDAVHALHYLIVRSTVWIEPVELGLRLPSVAGFVATTVGVVLVGRRLGSWSQGACAGAVYALLPISSQFAQEARSYAWVSAAAVFASLALLRLVEQSTRRRVAVYALLVVLLGYLHLYALLLLVAHGAYVLWSARPAARRVVIAWAVAAIAVLPLVLVASGQRERQLFWLKSPRPSALIDLLDRVGGNPWLGMVLAAMALAGAWRLRRSPLPVLWLLLPVIVSWLISQVHPIYQVRYVLYVVPALALLAGAGLDGLARRLGRGRLPFIASALVAVAALGLQQQQALRAVDSRPDDLRSMTRDLGAAMRPDDALVLEPAEFGPFVDVYGGPFDRLTVISPGAVPAVLDRVWVLNRGVPDVRRYPRLQLLDQQLDLAEVRSYGVVTLSLWTRQISGRSG